MQNNKQIIIEFSFFLDSKNYQGLRLLYICQSQRPDKSHNYTKPHPIILKCHVLMWTLLIHKQGQVLWFLILLLNNNVWSGHFLRIQTILWDSEECPAHSAQFCKQSLEQLAHLVAVVVDIQEAITWSCPKVTAIIIIVLKSNIEKRVVKGISWLMISPFFPVKCGIANFFLVNHDSLSSHETWFCKIIFSEMRNKCLICSESWFSLCLCYFQQL